MNKWYLIWIILTFNSEKDAVEFEVYRQETATYEECVAELAEVDAKFMGSNLNYQIFCTDESNLEVVFGETVKEQ